MEFRSSLGGGKIVSKLQNYMCSGFEKVNMSLLD